MVNASIIHTWDKKVSMVELEEFFASKNEQITKLHHYINQTNESGWLDILTRAYEYSNEKTSIKMNDLNQQEIINAYKKLRVENTDDTFVEHPVDYALVIVKDLIDSLYEEILI